MGRLRLDTLDRFDRLPHKFDGNVFRAESFYLSRLFNILFRIGKWDLNLNKFTDLEWKVPVDGKERTTLADILNGAGVLLILNCQKCGGAAAKLPIMFTIVFALPFQKPHNSSFNRAVG